MRWWTTPLAPIASLNAVPSRPLSFLEHLSSTSTSLDRVSLIPWTVTPSSSGLTRFLSSRKIEAVFWQPFSFSSSGGSSWPEPPPTPLLYWRLSTSSPTVSLPQTLPDSQLALSAACAFPAWILIHDFLIFWWSYLLHLFYHPASQEVLERIEITDDILHIVSYLYYILLYFKMLQFGFGISSLTSNRLANC